MIKKNIKLDDIVIISRNNFGLKIFEEQLELYNRDNPDKKRIEYIALITDNDKNPLDIEQWTIAMDIVPPNTSTPVVELSPGPTEGDGPGEFTVALTAEESALLTTGDRFDIQMSSADPVAVWTVAQGTMTMIDSVTE